MASAFTESQRSVNITIVEDEPLFRDLLARTCSHSDVVQVCGAFADGESAVSAFQKYRDSGVSIHVALLDVQLGDGMNGIKTAFQLRALQPDLGILFLSNHRLPSLLAPLELFDRRGYSYLLKTSVTDFDALQRAIVGSAEGAVVIDKEILATGQEPSGSLAQLTDRQREILDLVVQGYSNAAIAQELFVSTRTVDNHLSRIYQTLGLEHSDLTQPRVQAVVRYLSERFPIDLGHFSDH